MVKIKNKDYNLGKKRVNLSLDVSDYEDLMTIAKERGFSTVGTTAKSILIIEIRKQAKELYKQNKPFTQTNLFDRKKV